MARISPQQEHSPSPASVERRGTEVSRERKGGAPSCPPETPSCGSRRVQVTQESSPGSVLVSSSVRSEQVPGSVTCPGAETGKSRLSAQWGQHRGGQWLPASWLKWPACDSCMNSGPCPPTGSGGGSFLALCHSETQLPGIPWCLGFPISNTADHGPASWGSRVGSQRDNAAGHRAKAGAVQGAALQPDGPGVRQLLTGIRGPDPT